jgi:hypothetical protein
MERTLNQIKKDVQEIATQHRQVNSFFWGDFIDAISRDAINYTLMVATIQPGTMGDGFVNVNLNIVVCDKYNEEDYNQIDEVHSDCLQICRDIFITMKQNRFDDYLDIDGDISTIPFINKGHDITAGWSMDISLKVYDDMNWCAIPFDSFDFGN